MAAWGWGVSQAEERGPRTRGSYSPGLWRGPRQARRVLFIVLNTSVTHPEDPEAAGHFKYPITTMNLLLWYVDAYHRAREASGKMHLLKEVFV